MSAAVAAVPPVQKPAARIAEAIPVLGAYVDAVRESMRIDRELHALRARMSLLERDAIDASMKALEARRRLMHAVSAAAVRS